MNGTLFGYSTVDSKLLTDKKQAVPFLSSLLFLTQTGNVYRLPLKTMKYYNYKKYGGISLQPSFCITFALLANNDNTGKDHRWV